MNDSPPRPNGLAAFETLGKVLAEDKWNAVLSDDEPYRYEMDYRGKHGWVAVYARVRPEIEFFLVYGLGAFEDMAPEFRPAMMELITRVNYGMRVGNFELNMESGQLRFKSSIDFRDTELTAEMIRNAMLPCYLAFDRHLPAIMGILENGKTVQEALELVVSPR